tara:strand:- start:448 stop:723 length:276 start_codon:yes stop_codon:yes gene_type:complete
MGKKMNVIEIDHIALFVSLNAKIDKMVILQKAYVEMFNNGIEDEAVAVVRDHASQLRDEIYQMLDDIKDELSHLRKVNPCTHGNDSFNPVV